LLAQLSGPPQKHSANLDLPMSSQAGNLRQLGSSSSAAESAEADGATFGHLIVVISEPRQAALDIQLARGDESHRGFARAAAYTSIGPGGGVLTQSTLYENPEADDVSTVQYGIVYGQPAVRLTSHPDSPLSGQVSEQKEVQP